MPFYRQAQLDLVEAYTRLGNLQGNAEALKVFETLAANPRLFTEVLKGPNFSRADRTGDDFPFLPLVEVFAARKPQPRAGKSMRRLLRHG